MITGAICTCLSATPKTLEIYPALISLGDIPADSIASTDALRAISIILSLSFPYLVLPAPKIHTFSTA